MVQKMLDQMVFVNLVDDEKVSFLNAVRSNRVSDPTMELRKVRQRARARAQLESVRFFSGPLDLSLPRPGKYEVPVPDPFIPDVIDNDVPLDLSMRVNYKTGYTEKKPCCTDNRVYVEKWPPRPVWPVPKYKWQLKPV